MTRAAGMGMVLAMHARVALALALAAGSAACSSGTETGNPSISGALSYTGYSSDPRNYGVRESAAIATVDNAWLDLDDVRISPSGSCGIEGGEAFTVPALGLGDHAAGKHNSTPFSGKAGAFCRASLPFVKVPPQAIGGDLPAALEDSSLFVAGTLADGTPFTIASSATPTVELHADGAGFALAADSADALFAFDFARWLARVDFAAAERTQGQIVISASSNPSLLLALEADLASGIGLYRDRAANGRLDPEDELLASFE